MLIALAWQDHAVIVTYLVGMLLLGAYLARRQRTDDEYFLAGRRMPWFAVGISVIASLLSSLTYLSEPGEVWNSGITHVFGKMVAIPFEMLVVWLFCIPFMMRFRLTSAYEYLELRFDQRARRLGVALFMGMVILWMGFVVLASARALAVVSEVPLAAIIATVGIVATLYTMLGGLRAVIWTDVVQVGLLIGGGLFTIGYVSATTGSWLPDWYAAARDHLQTSAQPHHLPWFSWDPTVRATVLTVALNMFVWHVCTHTANQMTVQRYFSTSDMHAARRSFITGSLFGVGINLMLVVVGLAVLYFYLGQNIPLERGLDPARKQDRDLIFPTFAVFQLYPGFGGAILAALLAAAMSSIDSGVNSIATVLSVESQQRRQRTRVDSASPGKSTDHVVQARWITLVAGLSITAAAYGLDFLPGKWGIVDLMPRTFNAFTGPLGALFLVGMFLPRAGSQAAVSATSIGLLVSVGLGYFDLLGQWLLDGGWLTAAHFEAVGLLSDSGQLLSVSFTWVMPASVLATLTTAFLFSLIAPAEPPPAGLDWSTRHVTP